MLDMFLYDNLTVLLLVIIVSLYSTRSHIKTSKISGNFAKSKHSSTPIQISLGQIRDWFPLTWLYHALFTKLRRLSFLWNGVDIMDKAYREAKGNPFTVEAPGRRMHMVTSPMHLEELNRAPLNVLSLHAVAKDFLQPKHTMHGFQWQDVRGVEGTGFVRAIRHNLTSNLSQILPGVDCCIRDHIRSSFTSQQHLDGQLKVPLYDFTKNLVSRVNYQVFFGANLATNTEFFEAMHRFPYDTAHGAEVLRLVPGPIGRFVARWVGGNFDSSRIIAKHLTREIERRQYEASHGQDVLQWLIDTSPKQQNWGIDRMVGEVMGVWYGAVHTLAISMFYALHDLYSRPEYIASLRAELSNTDLSRLRGDRHELPLMDSFLSESARFSSFECTAVRRQALQSFTFSDGVKVAKGDWVCLPSRSIMQDQESFSNPLEFDGFRFCALEDLQDLDIYEQRQQRLVDTSDKWLMWGYGRIICPGRFFATAVLKSVLSRILLEYYCEVAPAKSPAETRSFNYRTSLVPKAGVALLVKERA